MRFRILGPLEVCDGETWRTIGAAKWRSLLALLMIDFRQVVSVDRIVDQLWGDNPPSTATGLVYGYVARLRGLLHDHRGELLVTRSPGYQLLVDQDDIDAGRFVTLVSAGTAALRAGEAEQAAATLAEAVDLWRGPVFADVPVTPLVRTEVARLDEQRLVAVEARVDADLACGRHVELVGELTRLTDTHPLREQLWERLMLALYRSGRQSEALGAYRRVHELLANELGIEPTARLRDLHRRILSASAELLPENPVRPSQNPVTGPRQLPAEVDHFIGRERQLDEVCRCLVRDGTLPVVVVTGEPGIGKTAFAVRAGHRLESSFPDGQLFADLRGADACPSAPGEVLAQLLRGLGVPGTDIPPGNAERASVFRDRLAGKKVLLVLDNAATEDQVRPLLPGNAGCGVLITSRRRLTGLDASQLVRLTGLEPGDAMTLLAKFAYGELDLAASQRIAALCGGLPLALRIVGTKLRSLSYLTITDLASRLEDERHRLDELVAGDREVRAGFLLSCAGLDEPERRAFRLLVLLPGPSFASWAAAIALGEDIRTTERVLDNLVEANLLESQRTVAGARYHFHDLIRLLAGEKADREIPPAQQHAVRSRVLDGYLHLAKRADAELVFGHLCRFEEPPLHLDDPTMVNGLLTDALQWFDEEHECLRSAAEWAAATGLDETTCQLAAVMAAYLEVRAYWDDLTRVAELTLAAARSLASPYWHAYGLLGAGLAAQEKGDAARSQRLLTKCLETLPRGEDPQLEVVALLALGIGHRMQRRWTAAAECFEGCLFRLATLSEPRWWADTMHEIGILHSHQDEWDEAEHCLRQAVKVFADLGDQRSEAACLRELGTVRRKLGDLPAARRLFSRSRDMFHELGDQRREEASSRYLAETYR